MGSYREGRNCYPAPSSSKWDVVCFSRYVIQPQPRIHFLSLRALISEMICFQIVVLHCATGNFCAWRVPLHNDERKHNLISTFIYRADCSNGVITISSAPRSLSSSPSHTRPPSLALCLFRPYSFLEECIWNHANGNKWTNECFMNAFMMRKCKWGWVNEWMFNERLFNEKDLLTRALT